MTKGIVGQIWIAKALLGQLTFTVVRSMPGLPKPVHHLAVYVEVFGITKDTLPFLFAVFS